MSTLGRLKRIDLRDIWKSEALDFTPWLARDENLALLGETLGIELELEAVEQNVGPFRADILCKDTLNGSWVLIENQLERTDHSHLGQLITYAAGLDAVTIIWIAAKVADEHRAACDWLNEVTGENLRFFALEVELWRIGESPAAPKFNVVSKPNASSLQASAGKRAIEDRTLSSTGQMQMEYWQAAEALLGARKSKLRPRSAAPGNWISHGIGKSGVALNFAMNSSKNLIRAEIYLSGSRAKANFKALLSHQAEIEALVGEPLDWQEMPGNIECRICLFRPDSDPFDKADWPAQHDWLVAKAGLLFEAFKPHLHELNAQAAGVMA